MVQEFLSLNMKSSSSNYRQKCMELLKKFLMRLRIARQHIEALRRKALRGVRNDKQVPHLPASMRSRTCITRPWAACGQVARA